MIKAVLAYTVVDGVSLEDYNDWIVDVHVPDLLANPFIDRLSFDTVLRPVTTSSGGGTEITNSYVPYRVAEIEYADQEAYDNAVRWFQDNPIPVHRGPAGRTNFHFYVLTEVLSIDRDNMHDIDRVAAGARGKA